MGMNEIIDDLEKTLIDSGVSKKYLETVYKYFDKGNPIAKAMEYYEQYLEATYYAKFEKHYFFKR